MGNSLFNTPIVPLKKGTYIGFQYKPNKDFSYREIPAPGGGNGIFVYLKGQLFSSTIDLFESNYGDGYDFSPLFELPKKIDEDWKKLVESLAAGDPEVELTDKVLLQTQGFLAYTRKCLDYFYETRTGKAVIEELDKNSSVYIVPAVKNGNQIHNACDQGALPPIIERLIATKTFQPADKLIELTHQVFKKSNKEESLTALADQMNKMPLYSLFQKAPYDYPEGFLAANLGKIIPEKHLSASHLEEWFTNGDKSEFAKMLKTNAEVKVKEASIANYIIVALIISLHQVFEKGTGRKAVSINYFCKWNKEDLNVKRPPAIGLGHELIHAYWASRGEQLGKSIYNYSTLLFEMKCVGLGPWRNASISENAFREDWNKLPLQRHDKFNNYKLGPRLVYEDTKSEAEIKQFRAMFKTY